MLRRRARNILQNVIKTRRLLRTSWRVQVKLFFEHSTLHGVRYIAEKERPFREKFMWFACVVIGAVTTGVIIVSLWEKFQTNPTITGLDTDFHNWIVPFPAITVCQENPYNLSRLEEYVDSQPGNISKKLLVQLTKLSFDSVVNLEDIIETVPAADGLDVKNTVFQLMNTCEEIFESCEWASYNFSCCEDFFFPVFTERGFCYTFNSRHYEKTLPGSRTTLPDLKMRHIKETDLKWSIRFAVKDTSINMPIYILNSDEQASLDAQAQHVWDYKVDQISFSVKHTYTTDDTRQLSIKQRHCVFADEIRLETDDIYTYTACTRQCRMDNSMKLCRCVPHFYPQTIKYRHCAVFQLRCVFSQLESILSIEGCSCHLGCSNTVYEVEKLNELYTDGTNKLEARFVSWPMVRYKREVLFGWVDLLVSFGGIAGLFLGFSLLSGVEILYYFTIRAWCMVIRDATELERIRNKAASKQPKDYDLSLVPYWIRDPYPGNGINKVARNYYGGNLFNSKIAPLDSKWKRQTTILPPFGIEFIN